MILFDVRNIKTEKDADLAAEELISDVIEIKAMYGRGKSRAVQNVTGDLEQLKAKATLKAWKTVLEKLATAFKVLKKEAQSGAKVSEEVWSVV
jgi:aryl carrier-like protein